MEVLMTGKVPLVMFTHMGVGAISWASKKQPIVGLSTVEVEYVATPAATCQAVWMRRSLCHE